MQRSTVHLGVGSIAAIVLLRLAVGWHFYSEGIKKFDPAFTSAGFLNGAKGPLGPTYRSFATSPGNFQDNLAIPRRSVPPSIQQQQAEAAWIQQLAAGTLKPADDGQSPLIEFPPLSPYADWANAITNQWANKRNVAAKLLAGDLDAAASPEECFREYVLRLANYLAGESDAIGEYRHKLWRLEGMGENRGAALAAYQRERIRDITSETNGIAWKWKTDVAKLEAEYVMALSRLPGMPKDQDLVFSQLAPKTWLDCINFAVKWIVTGVGCCMLLGIGTRIAAAVGVIFLLSVMASQPPWSPGADTSYLGYQLVETASLTFLAAVGAGRWYGLDGVLRRCCSFCCGPRD